MPKKKSHTHIYTYMPVMLNSTRTFVSHSNKLAAWFLSPHDELCDFCLFFHRLTFQKRVITQRSETRVTCFVWCHPECDKLYLFFHSVNTTNTVLLAMRSFRLDLNLMHTFSFKLNEEKKQRNIQKGKDFYYRTDCTHITAGKLGSDPCIIFMAFYLS